MPNVQVEVGYFQRETSSETLNLVKGDDWIFTLYFRDGQTGKPIDINLWTVTFTVKDDPADPDPGVAQVSVTSHAQPQNGITVLEVPAATTAAINAGTYVYDFQVKDGNGDISSTMPGTLIVVDQITQAT